MKRALTASAALALVAVLAPAASAQPLNVTFSQNDRNGVCYFSVEGAKVPGGEQPMTLEFSYRVSDGNFGATIKVNGWPRAQAADPEKKIPMTLVLDTGTSKPSRSGGYDSGFNDTAWGGWGAGPTSDAVFALLDKAKTARVKFDGLDLGPFDLQMKGLAHVSLSDCAKRVKAASGG